MTYSQLTCEERYTISRHRMAGYGVARIGQILGRHRSTIHREIERNSVLQSERWTYSPSKAQKKLNGRLKRTRRGRQHEAWQYPEQVADTLKKYGEFRISFQTIYRHVRRDWRAGGGLYLDLRRRYKRRKRHYGLERRGRLPGKRMICERPAEVESRLQPGHWEIDTVKGASGNKHCIVTLVERFSGYVLIGKLPNCTVNEANRRIIALIKNSGLPFLTLTSDNGTEFNGYAEIEAATGVTVYSARPHYAWERGSNENTNGLIRQYLRKGDSMEHVTQRQCHQIAFKLNTRPRKRYGYDTPNKRLLKC